MIANPWPQRQDAPARRVIFHRVEPPSVFHGLLGHGWDTQRRARPRDAAGCAFCRNPEPGRLVGTPPSRRRAVSQLHVATGTRLRRSGSLGALECGIGASEGSGAIFSGYARRMNGSENPDLRFSSARSPIWPRRAAFGSHIRKKLHARQRHARPAPCRQRHVRQAPTRPSPALAPYALAPYALAPSARSLSPSFLLPSAVLTSAVLTSALAPSARSLPPTASSGRAALFRSFRLPPCSLPRPRAPLYPAGASSCPFPFALPNLPANTP